MKSFGKKLLSHLCAYLTCIIVVTALWNWAFSFRTNIKDSEKVSIFIGSYSDSFAGEEKLNQERPSYLKKVEVKPYRLDVPSFSTILSVHGYETADILILPLSYLSGDSLALTYAPISTSYQEIFRSRYAVSSFLEQDNNAYGIKIHDCQTHSSLISGLLYGEAEQEEDYYLLYNRKSLHLGDLSDPEKKEDLKGDFLVTEELFSL